MDESESVKNDGLGYAHISVHDAQWIVQNYGFRFKNSLLLIAPRCDPYDIQNSRHNPDIQISSDITDIYLNYLPLQLRFNSQ